MTDLQKNVAQAFPSIHFDYQISRVFLSFFGEQPSSFQLHLSASPFGTLSFDQKYHSFESYIVRLFHSLYLVPVDSHPAKLFLPKAKTYFSTALSIEKFGIMKRFLENPVRHIGQQSACGRKKGHDDNKIEEWRKTHPLHLPSPSAITTKAMATWIPCMSGCTEGSVFNRNGNRNFEMAYKRSEHLWKNHEPNLEARRRHTLGMSSRLQVQTILAKCLD